MPSTELDFAVIGAQKSASTYVHRCLTRHPQIDIPSHEVRVFEDPSYARGGPDELAALFGPRRPGLRRGIKRPDHLSDPAVPARLAAHAPDLRLVVVLRDPVQRAVSAYFHYVRLGFLPVLPLETGFAQVLDGHLERDWPRAADVVRHGLYSEHLTRYLEHFDRDQLLALLQPDLRREPVTALTRLLEFLDVDPAPAPALAAATRSANVSTYAPLRLRVQRSRNRFMFDYAPDRGRRTPRRMSPLGYVAAGGATALDRWVLAPFDRSPAPRLPAPLEQRLRAAYAEDTVALQGLVGAVPWADGGPGGER